MPDIVFSNRTIYVPTKKRILPTPRLEWVGQVSERLGGKRTENPRDTRTICISVPVLHTEAYVCITVPSLAAHDMRRCVLDI